MWPHPSTALIVLLLLQGKCWIHEVSPPRLHLLLLLLWWNDDFTDDCTDRSDRNDLPDHMTPTSAATYSVGWTSDWATWPYSTAGPTFLWFWWSMSHLSGQRSAFQFAERPKKKNPIGRFRCVWFEFFFSDFILSDFLSDFGERTCAGFFFPHCILTEPACFCDVGASYSLTYKNQSLQNPSTGMRTNITWPLRSINRNIVSVSSLEILALVVLAAPQIKDRRRRRIRTPCKQRVYQDGLSTPREWKKSQ